MLGIELDGVALGRGARHQIVPPIIAVGNHRHGRAGAAHDDDFFDGGGFVETFVDRLLQGHLFAAAPAAVGRDDQSATWHRCCGRRWRRR